MTLFLIGIWHGAGWNFVVYGTIHGLAMVIHRYFYKRSGRTKTTVDPKWMVVLKIFRTFHFVVLSRILSDLQLVVGLDYGYSTGQGNYLFGPDFDWPVGAFGCHIFDSLAACHGLKASRLCT